MLVESPEVLILESSECHGLIANDCAPGFKKCTKCSQSVHKSVQKQHKESISEVTTAVLLSQNVNRSIKQKERREKKQHLLWLSGRH